ncbi:hypothetical protein BJ322DRAFT_1022293 [Thelephora terrestris]|uniref:Uncharacterized protein n=1 Tax=Thelephora terrestris TaxID=56493 RepID=A0A9P6HC67_9AGAM|nr:hypothetical protein BJ322DRAFT_1022293 [Thelephora terrestris]
MSGPNLLQGELAHRLVKRLYGLTNKKDAPEQIARRYRRARHFEASESCEHSSEGISSDGDRGSGHDTANDLPELHHSVTSSRKDPAELASFSVMQDPAAKFPAANNDNEITYDYEDNEGDTARDDNGAEEGRDNEGEEGGEEDEDGKDEDSKDEDGEDEDGEESEENEEDEESETDDAGGSSDEDMGNSMSKGVIGLLLPVVPHVVLPHPVPTLPTKLFSPITDRKSLDSWDSSTHEDNFATERKPEHIPKSRRGRFEKGYLDIALEDAENARVNLTEENDVLRKIKYRGDERHMVDEPTPVTEAQLFPLAPMNATREAFKGILHAVGDAIEKRLDNIPDPSGSRNADVAKLNAIVQHLRNEPARSLVDKFIKGQDSSHVLSSSPDVDSETTSIEKRRLQAERDELDEDRRNLTEAALKLGRERAALEVQRLEFLEDRRAWDVKKMIDDLPPSPKARSAYVVHGGQVCVEEEAGFSFTQEIDTLPPFFLASPRNDRRSSFLPRGLGFQRGFQVWFPSQESSSDEDVGYRANPLRSPQSSLPPPPKLTSRAPSKLSAPSVTPDYSPLDHAPQPSTSDAHQLPPKAAAISNSFVNDIFERIASEARDTGISDNAAANPNSFVNDIFERVAAKASDTGISNKAVGISNSSVNDFFERISTEAFETYGSFKHLHIWQQLRSIFTLRHSHGRKVCGSQYIDGYRIPSGYLYITNLCNYRRAMENLRISRIMVKAVWLDSWVVNSAAIKTVLQRIEVHHLSDDKQLNAMAFPSRSDARIVCERTLASSLLTRLVMVTAYSSDLREGIVWCYCQGETMRTVADMFNVSVAGVNTSLVEVRNNRDKEKYSEAMRRERRAKQRYITVTSTSFHRPPPNPVCSRPDANCCITIKVPPVDRLFCPPGVISKPLIQNQARTLSGRSSLTLCSKYSTSAPGRVPRTVYAIVPFWRVQWRPII